MKSAAAFALLLLSSSLTFGDPKCTPVFPAIAFSGVQYSVQSTLNYPPPVLAGQIPLNVQFRNANESVVNPGTVSLRYTVDNQAVGPVLTSSFAWSLDTTALSEGSHSIAVLYVNEPAPGNPCYTLLARQYAVVVSNTGKPVTGPQTIAVIAPPAGFGPLPLPQYADFIQFPGYPVHPSSHPFPAITAPPAGGYIPSDLWSEPLVSSTSTSGEFAPEYWQLKNGSIVEDPLFTSLIGCDDLRRPKWSFDAAGPLWEQRKSHFDGLQDDANLSSYAVFTANLDGPGFYGISMDGRLFLLNLDGSIQTIAGWTGNRNVFPFHYLDGSIPMSSVENQQTLQGTFDRQFYFPTDLAIDPNNHKHIFVADMNNHRIALVDLSQNPPMVSTYAGVPGKAGYVNGAKGLSLFNQPSSIVIGVDGTMYVADSENAAIRKIDSTGNVSTLTGLGPAAEPSSDVVARAPLTYAPRNSVGFTSAYINYPNAIRFDSRGNLVLAETVSQTIRYLDLQAQAITTIAQFSNVGNAFGEQVWLDVDRKGNVGPVDDIIATMVEGQQNGLYRVPIGGTTQIPLPTITAHSTYPLLNGHSRPAAMPWTFGPWSVAIDDLEGRLVVSGVQSSGVVSLRLVQSNDPKFQLNLADYAAGRNIWLSGTVPNFPFGSRPSFAALHGFEGHSALGNVLNFDDMVSMNDAQLGAYLQNGTEGAVPRPELSGNDLRNVIYYIRRTATGGDLITPGPDNSDRTPPVTSAISAQQQDSTDVTVSWTTSKPSIGYVGWGTTSGTYFGWSSIESAYSTQHSVTMSNLPSLQTIYFVVRAKDQAGNQAVSQEQNLTLH